MEPARILLAILFPPLVAYLEKGTTTQFYLNVGLTMLFYVPGLFHVFVLMLLAKKS